MKTVTKVKGGVIFCKYMFSTFFCDAKNEQFVLNGHFDWKVNKEKYPTFGFNKAKNAPQQYAQQYAHLCGLRARGVCSRRFNVWEHL